MSTATVRLVGLLIVSTSSHFGRALRRSIREAEQATIDRALELDAEDSAAWAEAYAAVSAQMWERLEW